ncbi:MAG TPA: glycosyltransferase family 4 protein [Methanobacterium subterraneum]|uniref:Glycosyltransferase family 4 protein n=1 Tax=Methanobacterium subterraneum TaxID=59277 RepID=A0A7J4TIP3_9EURY|nr:glycosyltransferase family 4 protein [Methanobacterium subterraneum]
MNILVVQESDWIQRNPHQQHHLMERLSLRGHKIRVIDYEIDWKTNKNEGLFSKRTVFKDVHKIHDEARIDVVRPGLIKIPVLNYFSWMWTNWREINRQIKEFKPDVIVGFGLINTYIASRAAKKHRIPFVYYLIDVLYTLIPEKSLQYIGKQVKKGIIKNSDKVITINKKLSESAVRLGADAEKTIIIDAGIDLERFDPEKIDGSLIREEYGVKDDELLLFFMGWIYHFAGIKEVAEELGKGDYANIKLMVVGDGDAYLDVKKIQKRYISEEKIILTGKQPYGRIPEFIQAADLCILPAYPEEIIMQDIVPIKIYEYMAMGKPVLTTNLPGIKTEFGEDAGVIYVNKPEGVLTEAFNINININRKKARKFVEHNDWIKITDEFENTLKKLYTRD